MRRRKYDKYVYGVITLGIFLFMGIGYSVLTQVVKINGTANIDATWNILFTGINEKRLTHVTTKTEPVITSGTTATIDVELDEPGGQAIYEVTVANKGSIDAVVKDIKGVSETNQLEPKAIQFYINGIVVGDELNVNQTKTFEVVINYDKNAELHQGEFSKEISFTIDFEQKTQGSTVKPEMTVPNYSLDVISSSWSREKTVTITYPEGDNLIYQYSLDDGLTWKIATTRIFTMKFEKEGSIIARVSDGKSSLTGEKQIIGNIDREAPTVSVSGNTEEWSISKTLTINASDVGGSGLADDSYSFDGGKTWQDTPFKTFSTNQTVNIWVKDKAGNIKKQEVIVNKIDESKPTNVSLTKGSVTSSSITVIASATQDITGIRGYQFSIDGGDYSTEQPANSKMFTGLDKNREYTFKVKVIGVNGKEEESGVLKVSTNDINIPTYSMTPSADTWSTSKTVTITYPGEKESNHVYEYSKDGGTTWITVNTSSATVNFTTNGSVIARIRDTGNSNNTVTASTLTVSKIDTKVPTVSVSGNTDTWSINKTLTIQASDTESELASSPYSFDGGSTWQTATSKTFTTNQTVNVWVKDNAGNIAKQAITIGKIDTVAPSNVTLTKGSVTSSSITVTASATQANMGIRGYQFSMDGGAYSAEQTSVSKTFTGLSKNTSHTFKVKAIGKNGKSAESTVLTVSTNNIQTPTYSVTPSVDTWATSKTVTITYPGTKTDNLIYEYSKDGGTTWTSVTASSASVTFTSNGSVIARVRDTGNTENTTTASTLTVSKVDTTAPTVTVSGNTSDWSINKTLTIQASDTDSGLASSPYSFDGGNTWQASASKTFTTNQTVTIWVKDQVGNIEKQSVIINKIDTVAPSNVTLTQGSITSSSITVTASATQANMGIRGYQFSIDGGSYGAEQTSVSKTFTGLLKNTSHTFKVKAIAMNGKETESSTITLTTSNIVAPSYSLVEGSMDDWSSTKEILITFERNALSHHIYEYSNDGGTTWVRSLEATTTVTFTSNGTLIARIRDTGNVENTTTASTLTVSKIDTTPPTFTVSENTSDWSINKTLTIEATDTESGVSKSPYSFNRGSTWSTAKSHTFSTNQTVDVWVRDNVGNIAKQTFVISKIDTLAPSNVSLTKGSVTANSISVTANATQNQMGIRGYQFSINDGTWSTEQTSISKVFTDLDANTTYSIKVRVWGKNGKFTDSSPLSVTTATIELTPPTYSVSPAGDVVADTKQVTIQFPSPRPAGAEYHYSLDGGKTWPPASETAVVTFQKSGTLIARITYGNKTIFGTTLTVTNITGRATSTADKITGLSFNLYNASTAGYGLRVCFPYGSVTSNANVYYTIGSGRQVEISHDIGACYTTGMLDFEYNKLYSLEFSTYMYENKYSKVYFCYATNDGYGPNVECVEDPTIPTNMPTSPATTETPETTTPNYS